MTTILCRSRSEEETNIRYIFFVFKLHNFVVARRKFLWIIDTNSFIIRFHSFRGENHS